MESVDRAQATSDLLFDLWTRGKRVAQLPSNLQPASEAEAYDVQALIETRSARPLFGWKIAATSLAGQAHIGVNGPLAGRILQERVIADGAECPLGSNLMRVAELEFAFRMAQTMPPSDSEYTVPEVLACVGTLHPAIEIPDTRLDDFEQVGAPQLIADNACANYFVLGPAAPDIWRELDLASHTVAGRLNEGPIQAGIGSNVLGDPRIALAWLANRLSSLGIALEVGHVVTTGTCLVPMTIKPGDGVAGDFGGLGKVSLNII